MTTLFVNACVRGNQSHTLSLCRDYLGTISDEIVEVNVVDLNLKPFDASMVIERCRKQQAGHLDDPLFALSRQFAEADHIVIGAPYWDLLFPAVLKIYLEHVSVCDIAFRFTPDARCEGMCRARSLVYITTSGGFIGDFNFGYEYLAGLARMFGIPETFFVAAEGLDVEGIDVEGQMAQARTRIASLRESVRAEGGRTPGQAL